MVSILRNKLFCERNEAHMYVVLKSCSIFRTPCFSIFLLFGNTLLCFRLNYMKLLFLLVKNGPELSIQIQ